MARKQERSLARRSVESVAWNSIANLTKIVVLFVRSVMLARLLPVEVFGTYALAGATVGLSSVFTRMGIGGAFLHRTKETEDEEQAAAVHFTLKLIFTLVWATTLGVSALVFTSKQHRVALLLLTFTTAGLELAQTPQMILIRRVVHRRLALIQLFNVLLTTLVALGLAWFGMGLWALLATDIVTLLVTTMALYVWRPVWKPRLVWSLPIIRYFLRFGSQNFLAILLLRALDRVDDLWTGVYLGSMSLGFYSRAYTFATYPRRILAAPINNVAGGTYAELKNDRLRLSKAFFRINALLARSGFMFAGLLALVAPEFIALVLGEKWLPMLSAFRLMLVFTLLDPIKTTVAHLFVAVGRPDQIGKARVAQLMVLVVGLFALGPPMGIAGVALAVDGMLMAGMIIMLWQSRAYVTFSSRRLFVAPGLALLPSVLLSICVGALPGIAGYHWRAGLGKAVTFLVVYGAVLLILDRHQIPEMFSVLSKYLFTKQGVKS